MEHTYDVFYFIEDREEWNTKNACENNEDVNNKTIPVCEEQIRKDLDFRRENGEGQISVWLLKIC